MGGGIIDNGVWEIKAPSNEVRTMVLVGRTGNGKSATGNSILGRKAFESMFSMDGVTRTCQREMTKLKDGMIINVIDTPGLFDFSDKPECIKEIAKCIDTYLDGFHAILVVMSIKNRFSREDEAVVDSVRKLFGTKISDYMIMVFTGGDAFPKNNTIYNYLCSSRCPKPLKEILCMAGNRFVLFDNETEDKLKKKGQLDQLVKLVNTVVARNDGKLYDTKLFSQVKIEKTAGCSKEELLLQEPLNQMKEMLKKEKSARLKMEEGAKEAQQKSKDEISKLKYNLERAKEDLQKSRDEISKLRNNLEGARREAQDLANQSCAIQ